MVMLSLCFVALATVLGISLVKLISSCGSRRKASKRLPPGPWTMPIIGSLHHVLSALPHRDMAELSRRHGPLMSLQLGEIPTVVVSSAEAAALIMKTNDLNFADRPRTPTLDIFSCGGQGIGFAPYGEHWRQMRKASVAALLSAKQVKRLEGIRAEEVDKLLHFISASPRECAINLSEKFAALSNNIASRAVFSDRFARQDEFLHQLEEVVPLLGGLNLVDLFPSSRLALWLSNDVRNMKRCSGRLQRIISGIVDERKAARAVGDGTTAYNEDMLGVLLQLQEEDSLPFPLTTELIGVVILDLFAAATDTSGTILEWAMSELFNNPKVMAKAQSEVRQVFGREKAVITNTDLGKLHYMRMVIKEVLRTHPLAPLLVPRETREDCKIMGYDIPKGTIIHINAFAISRDPSYWESPEEFKPDRFENSNIDYYGSHFEFTPFGAGRRQCPGILFGMSIVEIGLANLLYHFDWVHPNGRSELLDMSEIYGLTVGRRLDLKLIAIPHPPSTST